MAVNRQANFLGQQRVDIPHLRGIESGICYDFDAVGLLITGGVACVVSGFEIANFTTVMGANATAIVLKTAGSRIVHPLASDSGSFFQVSVDRANEVLDTNNPRVLGSWTPSAVNYVGADLLRSADNTTSDIVKFIDTSSDSESDEHVPLARTMDYVITISTSPFSISPTICPIAKVTLNANSVITAIQDARNLLFRLGSGGDAPKNNNPFGWPGGRNENSSSTELVAGDRSIKSLKQWCDAIMTRLQEIGGGEYWYSLTSDRNVRLAQGSSPFSSSGEAFEWVGNNLHWKGLKVLFDNSTGFINEIKDQTTDSSGLTDLADGECIYVDIDRSVNLTNADALIAQKAKLSTLGGSYIPGQRWVLATRIGAYIYIRDQSFPVGSSWKLATTSSVGAIKTTINANGDDNGNPIAVGLADSANAYYSATCGGLSHNDDITGASLGTGNLVIGRGGAAGDQSIFLQTNMEGHQVHIYSTNNFPIGNKAAVKVTQGNAGQLGRIIDFAYTPADATEAFPSTGIDNSLNAVSINADGSIAIINSMQLPTAPATVAKDVAQLKFFNRSDKIFLEDVDALFGLQVANANSIFSGWTRNVSTGAWTKNDTTALGTTWTGGQTVSVGSRVLVCWPLNSSLTDPDYATNEVFSPYYRIYRISNMGGSGQAALLELTSDSIFEGVTVFNKATTGIFNQQYFKLYTPNPYILNTDSLIWGLCHPEIVDLHCVMDGTGSQTPLYQSKPHTSNY